MSTILALDSSTEACSAALSVGETILRRSADAPRAHTRLLLPMVDELLAEAGLQLADLDALAFGRGPGSFTGIRIAASMAQGLAFAVNKPLLAISTLAAVAQGGVTVGKISPSDRIIAAIDARMNEIYWACYQLDADGLVTLSGEEQLMPPQLLTIAALTTLPADVRIIAAGSGWHYAEQIPLAAQTSAQFAEALPDAADIVRLAQRDFARGLATDAEQAMPVYLRDKVAWQNG